MPDLLLHDPALTAFGEFITRTIGLSFGPARRVELKRAVDALTNDLSFDDSQACIRSLINQPMTPRRLELLAQRLTVPETYFFRETACLDALAADILPPLIQARRTAGNKIRLWSAACCTGEEAYSIAITLMRTIPDWRAWDLTILGTDLNPHNLHKAREGVYGEWSFRGAPVWLKSEFFKPTPDGRWEIQPHVKQAVQFTQLNLAEETYSPLTAAMDVIFCGNVLMYFSDDQATKTLQKFCRTQADGGWLIVGPNDSPRNFPTEYKRSRLPGGVVYRKTNEEPSEPVPAHLAPPPPRFHTTQPPPRIYPPRASAVTPPIPKHDPATSVPSAAYAALAQNARDLANQGRLPEALKACDQWIAVDKSNPLSHYMRAIILMETGQSADAAASLRTVLYLQPDFVMAHFTLASINQNSRRPREAQKHMANVAALLAASQPTDIIPESDGMTAQRLLQIAADTLQQEAKS